jgi:hypothetical protein
MLNEKMRRPRAEVKRKSEGEQIVAVRNSARNVEGVVEQTHSGGNPKRVP